jgi:hypothetical protein
MPARTAIAAKHVSLFAASFIIPSLRAFFEAVHNRPDFIPIVILPTIRRHVRRYVRAGTRDPARRAGAGKKAPQS